MLRRMGFEQVAAMRGGLSEWRAQALPVEHVEG
jgi:3-mercaptopyruvate sulfurtransferase SseA